MRVLHARRNERFFGAFLWVCGPPQPHFSISRKREIYNQTAVCRSAALPLLLRVQEEEEAAHSRLQAVDLRAASRPPHQPGTPDNPPPCPPSPQGPERARRRSLRKKRSWIGCGATSLGNAGNVYTNQRCLESGLAHTRAHIVTRGGSECSGNAALK